MSDFKIEIETEIYDADLDVRATFEGVPVGYANCDHKNGRLCIRDMRVYESLPQFPLERFRGRGIGSKLLTEVISRSMEMGMHEVWGSVTAADITDTPHLLEWYKRCGFTISEPDGDCLETAVRKISRKL